MYQMLLPIVITMKVHSILSKQTQRMPMRIVNISQNVKGKSITKEPMSGVVPR